jgi:hypothetical protein
MKRTSVVKGIVSVGILLALLLAGAAPSGSGRNSVELPAPILSLVSE